MITTNRKQVLTDNSCAFYILEAGCREYIEKCLKSDSKELRLQNACKKSQNDKECIEY